ncbi:hypothetical protein S7711_10937 [Stachybotrys chartarum IBT 7711]|uniref:Uncharacterized protein n=1 Tax=Stachybotrys chartarum (strain CBS 109288 / IBT 7711) TaxID=1280523 RepID=A0A084B975_STACB|nr:hypothetical protein S7711_10937 [Stachybotrys chartarum IBT 7711]
MSSLPQRTQPDDEANSSWRRRLRRPWAQGDAASGSARGLRHRESKRWGLQTHIDGKTLVFPQAVETDLEYTSTDDDDLEPHVQESDELTMNVPLDLPREEPRRRDGELPRSLLEPEGIYAQPGGGPWSVHLPLLARKPSIEDLVRHPPTRSRGVIPNVMLTTSGGQRFLLFRPEAAYRFGRALSSKSSLSGGSQGGKDAELQGRAAEPRMKDADCEKYAAPDGGDVVVGVAQVGRMVRPRLVTIKPKQPKLKTPSSTDEPDAERRFHPLSFRCRVSGMLSPAQPTQLPVIAEHLDPIHRPLAQPPFHPSHPLAASRLAVIRDEFQLPSDLRSGDVQEHLARSSACIRRLLMRLLTHTVDDDRNTRRGLQEMFEADGHSRDLRVYRAIAELAWTDARIVRALETDDKFLFNLKEVRSAASLNSKKHSG